MVALMRHLFDIHFDRGLVLSPKHVANNWLSNSIATGFGDRPRAGKCPKIAEMQYLHSILADQSAH